MLFFLGLYEVRLQPEHIARLSRAHRRLLTAMKSTNSSVEKTLLKRTESEEKKEELSYMIGAELPSPPLRHISEKNIALSMETKEERKIPSKELNQKKEIKSFHEESDLGDERKTSKKIDWIMPRPKASEDKKPQEENKRKQDSFKLNHRNEESKDYNSLAVPCQGKSLPDPSKNVIIDKIIQGSYSEEKKRTKKSNKDTSKREMKKFDQFRKKFYKKQTEFSKEHFELTKEKKHVKEKNSKDKKKKILMEKLWDQFIVVRNIIYGTNTEKVQQSAKFKLTEKNIRLEKVADGNEAAPQLDIQFNEPSVLMNRSYHLGFKLNNENDNQLWHEYNSLLWKNKVLEKEMPSISLKRTMSKLLIEEIIKKLKRGPPANALP